MFRYVVFLVLTTFLASPCWAQDDIIPTSYRDNDRDRSITRPQVEDNDPHLDQKVLLDLDILWTPPRVSFPNYWSVYANQPHVRYNYEYKGFYGLVYKQFARGCEKFYRRALRNTWAQSHLPQSEIDSLMREYNLAASDPLHPWWKREFFFDNLPVEKGGSRVETITVGDTYELVSAGPLSLSNSGRVAWSGWRLSVGQDRDLPSRKLRRDIDGTTTDDDPQSQDPQRLSLGISPPSGNLYTGSHWTVSGNVKLGVRVNTLQDNKSSITGKLEILGYTGYNRDRFIAIEIKGRARPFINDYAVEMSIALLTF